MKKIIVTLFFILFLAATNSALAQPQIQNSSVQNFPDEFYKAEVINALDAGKTEDGQSAQRVEVEILNGAEKGKKVLIEQGTAVSIAENQKVEKGSKIIITKTYDGEGNPTYYINDTYRLTGVFIIAAIFFALAAFFGRKKGIASILGLVFSILVLIKFVIPQIVEGHNPLLISLIGAFIIAVISIYLAHGFNKKSTIALVSTLITLGIAAGLSIIFISLSKLTGIGTEEAFYLQMNLEFLNAKGFLLGGIIIGVLGVLDDVTTAQVATIYEIHDANPNLNFSQLYKKGISVGKEHIASLVNTLALAYAGASFPILILFAIDKNLPLWVNLNNEYVIEEIIRTLVGSTALIFAVPIATFLAVRSVQKKSLHR